MTRRRYSWSMNCDKEYATRGYRFLEALFFIQHYFYEPEVILEFPNVHEDHSRVFIGNYPWRHESEHLSNETWHLHVEGIIAEEGKVTLIYSHTLIIAYYAIVGLVYLVETTRKATIRNSVRDMSCEKNKLGCLWCPFMTALIGLHVYNIFITSNMITFNWNWIERL